MSTITNAGVRPVQALGRACLWVLRFSILIVIYFALFAAGGALVAPYLPTTLAEPGPLPEMTALLLVCAVTVLVIMLMIYSSRWHGCRLILALSVAFYLVMTLVMQLEAWYFLLGVTIGPVLMWRLFLQGMPTAFLFIPVAALIMGRARAPVTASTAPEAEPMSTRQWLWRLGLVYAAYLVLYYSAGYFIAWQNPDVRAFYGSPGEALPFWSQMLHILTNDPWLIPYQLLRTLIWVAGAYLIIHGSRLPVWQTALVVGLALSVPQNVGHLLPNPLIPLNSVRISHLVETASSTFVFGLVVTWLLYPRYPTGKV